MALGRFSSAVQAAEVYDRAAYYVFREAASTNFGVAKAHHSLRRLSASRSKHGVRCLRALRVALAQQRKQVDATTMRALRRRAGIEAGAMVMPLNNGLDGSDANYGYRQGQTMVRFLVRVAIAIDPFLVTGIAF